MRDWRDYCVPARPACLVLLTAGAVLIFTVVSGGQQFEEVKCVAPVGDGDDDEDGRINTCDNCPDDPNGPAEDDVEGVGDQTDTDDDGDGDACDTDDDDDGIPDSSDPCPRDDNPNCNDNDNGNDNGNSNGNGNGNSNGNSNVNSNGNANGNTNDNGSGCAAVIMVYEFVSQVAIPDDDPDGVERVGAVQDHVVIRDLEVGLEIDHTWVGDVRATLSHGGVTVVLVDQPGFPAINFGAQRDGLDVILDDEATQAIENIPTGDGPAVVSPPNYAPNEDLSAFIDDDAFGDWVLTVSDNQTDDTGMLIGWSLQVTTDEEDCSNGNDNANTNDNANANANDNDNDNANANNNDNSGGGTLDVSVQLPITTDAIVPGGTVIVPLIAQNLGTAPAQDVVLRLQFSQFLEVLQTSGTLATETLTSLQWLQEDIPAGGEIQQSVTFLLAPGASGEEFGITAFATAVGDLVQSNNTASVTVRVQQQTNGNTNSNANTNGNGNDNGQELPPMPDDEGGCGACGEGASSMGMILLLSMAFIRNWRRRV